MHKRGTLPRGRIEKKAIEISKGSGLITPQTIVSEGGTMVIETMPNIFDLEGILTRSEDFELKESLKNISSNGEKVEEHK